MATPNPAAKSTKTTHTPPPGTTGGGTSGTTQTTTPPPYLYAIGRTTKSASNSYDTGTNTQEQAAHSQVSNPLSYETTESHYLNAGTSDHSSHLSAEAVSAGGDSATTTSKDWSSDIESGKYSTQVGESFFTSSTTGSGTAATETNSGGGNGYEETGELWSKATSEINATEFANGAGHETVETISDTKQLSQDTVLAEPIRVRRVFETYRLNAGVSRRLDAGWPRRGFGPLGALAQEV